MDGYIKGWMDGWMDGWNDQQIHDRWLNMKCQMIEFSERIQLNDNYTTMFCKYNINIMYTGVVRSL